MGTWWNDFKNNALVGLTQPPRNLQENGSTNGDPIDMKESQEGLAAILITGDNQNAGQIYVELEESDSASGPWTKIVDFITGGDAEFADQGPDEMNSLIFKRSKRFVRSLSTVGGGAAFIWTTVILLGMRRRVL